MRGRLVSYVAREPQPPRRVRVVASPMQDEHAEQHDVAWLEGGGEQPDAVLLGKVDRVKALLAPEPCASRATER